MSKKEGELILCRCFTCHKIYLYELMKSVSIKEPFEEAYITLKRFLCPECYERLKQFRFVVETQVEREKIKKEVKKKEVKDEEKEDA